MIREKDSIKGVQELFSYEFKPTGRKLVNKLYPKPELAIILSDDLRSINELFCTIYEILTVTQSRIIILIS